MAILPILGIFPEPSQDPVIQIANIVKLENEDEPFIKNCFVLGDCVPVIGAEIIVFEREKDMLEVGLS
jgi:DNA polymerase delta subunit 1